MQILRGPEDHLIKIFDFVKIGDISIFPFFLGGAPL